MQQRVQRVAAYAVIIRGDQILLSRLAPHVTRNELWTLPGGGLDHGEDPRDAVVREVWEETGLQVAIGETAHTFSQHQPDTWRKGRRVDAHALRIVYSGQVPADAPPPRVMEIDGSTIEAAWRPIGGVLDGTVPTVAMVKQALETYRPARWQRVAAYALITRGEDLLLTEISDLGHSAGAWTLPGGGVDHGEHPHDAVVREVREETGLECEVGAILTIHDVHLRGTAPDGRDEDYHGIHLIYAASVAPDADPEVREIGGTTSAVAWTPIADVESGDLRVLPVVRSALACRPRPPSHTG